MDIQLFGDRVLTTAPERPSERRSSGLFVPSESQGLYATAEVVAVGGGRVTEYGIEMAPSVKVGDRVLVPRHGGIEFPWGDEVYRMFNGPEIVGVVSDAKD